MIGEIHHCSHLELAERLRAEGVTVGALIVDAPYSERTHDANDGSAGRDPRSMKDPGKINRPLNYACWGDADVKRFVEVWAPLCSGWMVSITDTALGPVWMGQMEGAGRYAFSPIACVQSGSRIRLLGDGPAQWSTWAMVSRPRSGAWLTEWRRERSARDEIVSLPGAYVVPPGESDRSPVVGGKPLWLMRALVRDYSRPGDLVCDPCCGGGTTLLAAKLEGRRYIGCDIDAAHVEIARERLRDLPTQDRGRTLALFGEGGR